MSQGAAIDWTAVAQAAGPLAMLAIVLYDKFASRISRSAGDTAAMRELAAANTRIASALEKLDNWARAHELDDERRWAAHTEAMKAQTSTNDRLTAISENLARQITNVALQIAPEAEPREVPATRRRARA